MEKSWPVRICLEEGSLLRDRFTNVQIVTLALYLAGGEVAPVDTEDIAVKANEIAPRRFAWRKYPDQINIDTVRKRLWDATKPGNGALLVGSERGGWLLTQGGLHFAKAKVGELATVDLSRKPLNQRERRRHRIERARLLGEPAYLKFRSGLLDAITAHEAESFFRVDDYVMGTARQRKLLSIQNVFGDDPQLGAAVRELAKRVRGG